MLYAQPLMQPEFNITDTRKTQVVVATTVLLSFILFWQAAAIVLNDLASSAYYVGGIAKEAIGKSASCFILGVISHAWCAPYTSNPAGCSRAAARIVKEAMSGTMAKISVSALMFD